MHTTLLIFDIDGTLIKTRAGRLAFNRAFERVFGLKDAAQAVPMAGRTDFAIFLDVCSNFHIDPAAFDVWRSEFLMQLADAMTIDPGLVLPGVRELLEVCSQEPTLFLAVGTGNMAEGARIKLGAHHLDRYFSTGGFGDDGETREQVILTAAQRAQALHKGLFERIIVVGDTPHDIYCGKANGYLTIGVATGPYTHQELDLCAPDLTLDGLGPVKDVLSLLQKLR